MNFKIENDTNIWRFERFLGRLTIFLFTNKQIKQYKKNGTIERWKKNLFIVLKKYDKFNYLQKEDILLNIDSKENFDKHYDANWYYYYK